ncbi:MAG: hypothetical protein ABSE48_10200 [Verrucomicrobiota bacterium]
MSSGDSTPVIVTQPQNQMTIAGSEATFSVTATGGGLSYQWYVDATNPITGATRPSLELSDLEGSQVYELSVSVTNLEGATDSSNATLTVLSMLKGPVNPYPPGTFGYDLFQSTCALASSTNKTASYAPNDADLGTNSAVWTWPVNLSCVGYASDGYQSVLIASNLLLVCAHYGGEAGQTVTFHDTNGVAWVGLVTNVANVIADLDIAELSNAAPASIVIPYVLPPDYASYIAGQSLVGMPAFWLHKNTGHIDYAPVVAVADADWYGFGSWLALLHDDYGLFSGTSASGGDSGSPAFMSWKNRPILLYATTLNSDSAGMFVSGPSNWGALAALGLTSGMNILDLSSYPLQSAMPPTPDYNYLSPPTNQVANPGTLVTFAADVCVFGAPPFGYQWQFNRTNLAGATNDTLTVEALTNAVGNYSVIVSNELGSVTSGASLAVTGTVPVAILAPTVTNGNFQFGFITVSNYPYSVEYEVDLSSGSWTTLTNFTGSGSYWQSPPLPLAAQCFYRVR